MNTRREPSESRRRAQRTGQVVALCAGSLGALLLAAVLLLDWTPARASRPSPRRSTVAALRAAPTPPPARPAAPEPERAPRAPHDDVIGDGGNDGNDGELDEELDEDECPPETLPGGGVLSPDPPRRLVRCRIRDESGRPIPAAAIYPAAVAGVEAAGVEGCEEALAQADAEGRCLLRDPARDLDVRAGGWETRRVHLDQAEGQEPAEAAAELEIVLRPGRRILGRVVAAETGLPLPSARVEAEGEVWSGHAETDLAGVFVLEGAPREGPLSLWVAAPERVARLIEVEDFPSLGQPSGESGALRVELSRGVELSGQVEDAEGRPVEDADVLVLAARDPGHPRAARSDAQGRFVVSGLDPQDEHALVATTPGCSSSIDLEFSPQLSARRLVLGPRATLWIQGLPAGELRLEPSRCPAQIEGLAVEFSAEAAGPACFPRVAPGSYRVVSRVDGFVSREFLLAGGGTQSIEWSAIEPEFALRQLDSRQEALRTD